MAVTTVEQFKNKAMQEVEISGFEPDTTVTVKLKKLSLIGLVSSGKVPNQLMSAVTKLFSGGDMSKAQTKVLNNLSDMDKLLDIVCTEALVEPKYVDIKEYITDAMKMDIFDWSQGGIQELKPFRTE